MIHIRRNRLLGLAAVCSLAAALAEWAGTSPGVAAEVNRGFVQNVAPYATGEERNRQPDLWVMEIHFKQMRMIWVDITDPRTGEQTREQIWYLPYRVINRPLVIRDDAGDLAPQNQLDPIPPLDRFIPEFTLVTYDSRDTEIPSQIYLDEILPEALAVINRVERRSSADPVYRDSVNVVQSLPPAVDAAAPEQPWIYGVAVWRDVDPETDFFKVIVKGLSNGYELRPGPDGQPETWRKILVQKFLRRGDEFNPRQREFGFDGPPRWLYQPDGATAADAPYNPPANPPANPGDEAPPE